MVEYRAIESDDSDTCWRIERRVLHPFSSGEWKYLQSVCRRYDESEDSHMARVRETLRRVKCPKIITLEEQCK